MMKKITLRLRIGEPYRDSRTFVEVGYVAHGPLVASVVYFTLKGKMFLTII